MRCRESVGRKERWRERHTERQTDRGKGISSSKMEGACRYVYREEGRKEGCMKEKKE